MKFYGKGTIWDKEKDKALARFDKQGEFETEDPRTIRLLQERGTFGDYDAEDYKLNKQQPAPEAPQDTKVPEQPETPKVKSFDDMTLEELKAEATACGLRFAANIGAKTLANRLKEMMK
jgi:hypothetical protein